MKELTENTRSRAATGRAGGASGPRRRRGHNEALFTNTRWDARPPLLPGNPRTRAHTARYRYLLLHCCLSVTQFTQ